MAFEQRLGGGADAGHVGIWQKIKGKTEGRGWLVYPWAKWLGWGVGSEVRGRDQITLGLTRDRKAVPRTYSERREDTGGPLSSGATRSDYFSTITLAVTLRMGRSGKGRAVYRKETVCGWMRAERCRDVSGLGNCVDDVADFLESYVEHDSTWRTQQGLQNF